MVLIGCDLNTTVLPDPTESPVLSVIESPEITTTPDKPEETPEIASNTPEVFKTKNVSEKENVSKIEGTPDVEVQVEEGKRYFTKDEVATYIHIFNKLPPNYITKKEAEKKGWDNSKGNLWKVTDKMSIGGDTFGNREGLLPKKQGRKYYECDINYKGGYRGSERIVYSNDGLVFYTADHYETFEQLFGEENQ